MPVYSLKAKKTPTGIAKNQNEITRLSIVANVSLWPLSVPIAENLEHQVFEILQHKQQTKSYLSYFWGIGIKSN